MKKHAISLLVCAGIMVPVVALGADFGSMNIYNKTNIDYYASLNEGPSVKIPANGTEYTKFSYTTPNPCTTPGYTQKLVVKDGKGTLKCTINFTKAQCWNSAGLIKGGCAETKEDDQENMYFKIPKTG